MIRLLPRQVVVGVIGEVDLVTAPDIGCLLGALVDRGHTDVVLDLANLDFLDSSGLHAIEDTAARLRPSGGVLRIRSPSARTRWLLDLGEVSGLVEFEPSDPDLVRLGSEQPAGDISTDRERRFL
jgi:anti-sigma B factor antagonist